MKYKNNDFGVWISYEDPSDIGNKVEYLKYDLFYFLILYK